MQAQWKGLLSMLEQEESFENSLWIDIKLQKALFDNSTHFWQKLTCQGLPNPRFNMFLFLESGTVIVVTG